MSLNGTDGDTLVNGVPVPASGGGGGGPPLCDLAPVDVNPDNVAGPGVSGDASRCDHVHALPADIPLDLEAGTAVSAEGVAASVARSDHVHALPASTVPEPVGAAGPAIGISTEVARGDHVHNLEIPINDEGILQGLANAFDFVGVGVVASVGGTLATVRIDGAPVGSSNPENVAPDNVAAPGVGATAARSDHVHALPTAAPVGTGTANAAGTANTVSRSDHVHLTNLAVQDEGVPGGDAHTVNVVGAGASVAVAAGVATLTVPAGGGLGAPVRSSGTTANPVAPAAFAVIPEMTLAFTPTGTRAWVNFECSTVFAPSATGAAIAAEFRIRVAAVAVVGSDRTAGFTSDLIIGLVPGSSTQLVSYRRLLTGLTPGVPVTIDVQWREQPGATAGTVTALTTQRSLTLENSP